MSDEQVTPGGFHDVVVVGAGNGGLSAAALLRRRGCRDVALVEPSATHVYKPLQNYVGLGLGRPGELSRPQAELIPRGVRWYPTSAVRIEPADGIVHCADGTVLTGGDVVLAPGAVIDWDALPGAAGALRDGPACTTFAADQLGRTAELITGMSAGRAVFTLHDQPASGRETALKPLFLACDAWRRRGVLEAIEVILVNESAQLHPVPAIAEEIGRWLQHYRVSVRASTRVVVVADDFVLLDGPGGRQQLRVDLVHLLPPYAAPELITASGLDGPDTRGFVAVDPETLRHRIHPRIWAVGDAGDLGDARTGGALRQQVKIAVGNIARARRGEPLRRYDGYTVAPIATARGRLSFGEYDRSLRVRRSLPVPDEIVARRWWWWLDRYGLPQVYWRRIIRGRI